MRRQVWQEDRRLSPALAEALVQPTLTLKWLGIKIIFWQPAPIRSLPLTWRQCCPPHLPSRSDRQCKPVDNQMSTHQNLFLQFSFLPLSDCLQRQQSHSRTLCLKRWETRSWVDSASQLWSEAEWGQTEWWRKLKLGQTFSLPNSLSRLQTG